MNQPFCFCRPLITSTKLELILRAKGSDLIGLQNLQGENCLLDTEKASQSFNAFFEAIKDPNPEIKYKKFSSPSGAS